MGPPTSVAIASALPTSFFRTTHATAMPLAHLTELPSHFQHRGFNGPNVLPYAGAFTNPLTAAEQRLVSPDTDSRRWVTPWAYWRDRLGV